MKVRTAGEILEGVKKMTQIVKAIQRMEQFIKSVCEIVFQTGTTKDLESVLPTLKKWSEEMAMLTRLRVLKAELVVLLFAPAPDPDTVPEEKILEEVDRTLKERCEVTVTEAQRTVNELSQICKEKDLTKILEIVKSNHFLAADARMFIKGAREILNCTSREIFMEALKALERYTKSGEDTQIVDELLKLLNIEDPGEILPTVQSLVAYANDSA